MQAALDDIVLIGELALDGRLRPVRGVLPCLLAAREGGIGRVMVPEAALPEAALVGGIDVYGATALPRSSPGWPASATSHARVRRRLPAP